MNGNSERKGNLQKNYRPKKKQIKMCPVLATDRMPRKVNLFKINSTLIPLRAVFG